MIVMNVTDVFNRYFDVEIHFIVEISLKSEIIEWVKDNKVLAKCRIKTSDIIRSNGKEEEIPNDDHVELLSNRIELSITNALLLSSITFEFSKQEDFNLFKLTWG